MKILSIQKIIIKLSDGLLLRSKVEKSNVKQQIGFDELQFLLSIRSGDSNYLELDVNDKPLVKNIEDKSRKINLNPFEKHKERDLSINKRILKIDSITSTIEDNPGIFEQVKTAINPIESPFLNMDKLNSTKFSSQSKIQTTKGQKKNEKQSEIVELISFKVKSKATENLQLIAFQMTTSAAQLSIVDASCFITGGKRTKRTVTCGFLFLDMKNSIKGFIIGGIIAFLLGLARR